MDERRLVRNVVTAACAAAVLTTPLVRIAVGNDESWIAGNAMLLVIALALLALGYRRVSLRAVLGTMALLLWAITAASFWRLTGVVAAGGEVIEYGSAPLWLAAVMGPLVFLAFSIRRALQFVLAAVAAYALVFVVRAGEAAVDVLLSSGLWFQTMAGALVVLATLAVAHLAQRSAVERTEAEALRRGAAEERHELASAQRRRSIVFSRTATDLRRPMAELTDAVAAMRTAPVDDLGLSARRVATLSSAVLDEITGSLDALVRSANVDRAQDEAVPDGDADGEADGDSDRRQDLIGTVVVVAVMLVVLADALWLARQISNPAPDAVALAIGGSRMLLVVFLGAAIVAVRRPGPFGWSAVVASLLVHPIALAGAVRAGAPSSLVYAMVPSWRNALLSTTFVLLLSAVIERRVRARDAAQQETAAVVASSRELRRQQAAAELTYAEAAHELKNPLSVISAGARILSSESPLPEHRTIQLRDAVVRSTARLDDRLHEMRAVAGVAEDAASVATPAAADACQALEAAVAAVDVASQQSPIQLDLQCNDAQVVIVRDHLDHVMENLLGNALAYGEPGGPVRLVARVDGRDMRIEVANRGGSLTPEGAEHVFEPYWRAADSPEDPSGSGLGLAIVARLVQGWDGTRWCSVSDGWTRVGFTIPLARPDGAIAHVPGGAAATS